MNQPSTAPSSTEAIPDKAFISCLCCIPRSWTLFSNSQWTRVFESRNGRLVLIREFKRPQHAYFSEPVSFMDKLSLWLDEAVWNNSFDHLVIVASAERLKMLNRTLSVPVLARMIAEINWSSEKEKTQPKSRFTVFTQLHVTKVNKKPAISCFDAHNTPVKKENDPCKT